ncbi:acetoacetate--CoA ligase [Nocardia sp. NPDC003482]
MTTPSDAPTPVWVPDPERARHSAIARLVRHAATKHRAPLRDPLDYRALWRWSVDHLEDFWEAVWTFFEVSSPTPYRTVLRAPTMPEAVWFDGASVNYAEHVLRPRTEETEENRPALICLREDGHRTVMGWPELRQRVAALAATLRRLGVRPGDRVVGYVQPGAPAVIGMLAATAIGAVWSQCGQDYGARAAADRLGQLEPVVLLAADGYQYNGRLFDRRGEVAALDRALPTLRATIAIAHVGVGEIDWETERSRLTWTTAVADRAAQPQFEQVPFDHPLWVLFTSGTTGRPKGIVHAHGGVVLAHLSYLGLHLDLGPGDRFLWYTTTNWMMWNIVVSALLTGATTVVYDGAATCPDTARLWDIVAAEGVHVFGTSPAYLRKCEQDGIIPRRGRDLSRLRGLGVTGSPVAPVSYFWVSENVGSEVQLISSSGGTDVVSGFAAAAPTTPVWPGELSGVCLGVDLQAWDRAGKPVIGAPGELVVTRPYPSMPVAFWHDPDGTRLRATYYETYPGVWRHGDRVTVTDRGSVVVHGRSDATLNRRGVRLGSAEIYDAVEALPEIAEALVVGVEQADGGYWMPLFVRLRDAAAMSPELDDRIRRAIRVHASPRHVPDDIIVVDAVPHTRTGKKLEVPVKNILLGMDPAEAVSLDAVDDPAALDLFVALAARPLTSPDRRSGGPDTASPRRVGSGSRPDPV